MSIKKATDKDAPDGYRPLIPKTQKQPFTDANGNVYKPVATKRAVTTKGK